jgi:hypothetical protein
VVVLERHDFFSTLRYTAHSGTSWEVD